MIELIQEIKERLLKLEAMVASGSTQNVFKTECNVPLQIEYVNLKEGSIEEKMERIVDQLTTYKINMLTDSHQSQVVRSSIVAELGEIGIKYWLKLRQLRENYDEEEQIKRYNSILKIRSKNTMTFGAIVNRYRIAIDLYNENNL
jgi:hypothetical protein